MNTDDFGKHNNPAQNGRSDVDTFEYLSLIDQALATLARNSSANGLALRQALEEAKAALENAPNR